jgi:uncharacterized membrane protein YuzA (DUF378 family)
LFSIIVFGCISSQGWFEDSCRYDNDSNACHFGTTIGVLAFLGLMVFLILDALFDNISSVQHRKYVVIGDIAFSGLWAFLYFVNFCYLADAWRRTKPIESPNAPGDSGVEAAIAFSFFCIATFAGSTVLAVMRYRTGITEAFAQTTAGDYPGTMGGGAGGPPQAPYYAGQQEAPAADPYQQGGFNTMGGDLGTGMGGGGMGGNKMPPQGDFQPPTY